MNFVVERALLVNEGGLQCLPIVFARPLSGDGPSVLGDNAFLNGFRVLRVAPSLAADLGPGLVAFVLEDSMDVRFFHPGDTVHLS